MGSPQQPQQPAAVWPVNPGRYRESLRAFKAQMLIAEANHMAVGRELDGMEKGGSIFSRLEARTWAVSFQILRKMHHAAARSLRADMYPDMERGE